MNFPLPSKFLTGIIKDRGANEKVKTIINVYTWDMGLPGSTVVKNPPANARDAGLFPGSERSPREEMALQCSCLENPRRIDGRIDSL